MISIEPSERSVYVKWTGPTVGIEKYMIELKRLDGIAQTEVTK